MHDIQWNTETHSISIKGATIALTVTEYRLLYPLRYGTPVTYKNLTFLAYNYTFDKKAMTMLDKHIDRIRRKLRGTGFYIYCVLGYGYLLLPRDGENA
jgi:DNA-binding response OmpR family regulator